jgi:hypothetical protein
MRRQIYRDFVMMSEFPGKLGKDFMDIRMTNESFSGFSADGKMRKGMIN